MPVTLVLALTLSADAAEVVWLSPPADESAAALVADQAEAKRRGLVPMDLRTAATDWSEADLAAYRSLEQALRDVRQYETRLDGELVIMADLAEPIAAIDIVRNDADRAALFSALAYQGFAVDRFFADALATDERAAPYRVSFEGLAVELPWADAVALDPDRQVTPYDIAEAPQRVAYGEVQATAKKALPARLVPKDLPAGAALVVDGRRVEIGPAGTITLVPGRHLVHVEREGHVLARWDVRLAPGERLEASVPLGDAAWQGWLDTFAAGTPGPLPEGVGAAVQALGGEVWLVDGASLAGKPKAWRVLPDRVEPLALDVKAARPAPSDGGGWSAAIGLGGGWLSSGNFYTDDPAHVLPNMAAVNAGTTNVTLSVGRDLGPLRIGAGLDTTLTLGDAHVARYGSNTTRLRPYAHVAAGLPMLQATAGYLFPHHVAVGLRGALPLTGALELAAGTTMGLGTSRGYDDGSTDWVGLPVYSAWGGLAFRLGS